MTPGAAQNAAPVDVRELLDSVFADAIQRGASDIHVEPAIDACDIRFRQDGLLATAMTLPAEAGRSVALRLMVLAHLLTYRLDVPQEGRASLHHCGREIELRISIMPTIHGLRAAVRLPAAAAPRELTDLGLDYPILQSLRRFARADTGMLVITGPAGSGKTTTIYALLSYLGAHSPGSSIVALEDPVERALPGITQIEVKPFGQLTYEKALRSILRQDPQILMLGEIRDAATAQLAVQAAMTGHRLITTLHAPTSTGAIARLLEMGLETYQITTALWGVLAQRLIRKTISRSTPSPSTPAHCGPEYRQGGQENEPRAFDNYLGRTAVGELLLLDPDLRSVILNHPDIARLNEAASMQPGFAPLRRAAEQLVQRGITDPSELTRIFGDGESL